MLTVFCVSGTVLSKGNESLLAVEQSQNGKILQVGGKVDQNGMFLTISAGWILSFLLHCRLSNSKQSQSIADGWSIVACTTCNRGICAAWRAIPGL